MKTNCYITKRGKYFYEILENKKHQSILDRLNVRYMIVGVIIILLIITSVIIAHAQDYKTRIVAEVIAAEACGEGKNGMQCVANVIANRAKKQHKTPYEIVTQKNQFFGYTSKHRLLLYLSVKNTVDKLAENIMDLPDLTNGATNFENINRFGKPKWARKMLLTLKYKNHNFYK